MAKRYEMRYFSGIPHNLRDKVKDLDGNRVELKELELTSRILIEISPNPGVTPYLLRPGQTFYDFFSFKAGKLGVDLNEISDRLLRKFPGQC